MSEYNKNTETEQCTIPSVRRSAMEWWKSQLGNRYPIMVMHRDKILNAENRHPMTMLVLILKVIL